MVLALRLPLGNTSTGQMLIKLETVLKSMCAMPMSSDTLFAGKVTQKSKLFNIQCHLDTCSK